MTSTDRPRHRLRRAYRQLAVAAVLTPLTFAAATPAAASGYVPINGSGSTWSAVALTAWAADVRANGLVVNYNENGSSAGRSDFIQSQDDFAISEIPFEDPPEAGQQVERPSRPYAYLPIVAGGTSFMYHLTVGGHLFRNLRLSGSTLTGIFTGHITKWNDPAITKDNGFTLPAESIVPVIRADGAGAAAQFSRYMWKQYPSVWCPFAAAKLRQSTCGLTSFYPNFGNSKAQVGSDGVANYVSSNRYGEGAIGFVEFAYAKRVNFPVASLLNRAEYHTQPTPGDVAVALTRAQINHDRSSPLYLTQDLDQVYTNPDRRTYPLSSYSYMIEPTSTAKPFTTDKGRSLSTFINYFLCAGQQKASILGYSPLPKNLVEAGFQQVRRVPGAVAPPSIGSCANPALQILQTAAQPLPCQKQGAAPCGAAATPAGPGAGSGSGSHGSAAAGSTAAASGGSGSSPGSPGTAPGGHTAGTTAVDPVTGAATTTTTAAGGDQQAVPVDLESGRGPSGSTATLYSLSALLLLAAVLVPPVAAVVRRRRRNIL